ncbi:putative ABC transporter ATP-binding protein YbhF [bacterium HR39]|nr:putative ABC transporter ATP-binding protein YbhF [bacterium HR39]
MEPMVVLDRLTRDFGPVRAVDSVSFSVRRGEVVGFLGPNGAGKTTTMRMITGYLLPTSGTARVMGFDVVEAPLEVKRRLGYLPEGAPLYGDMTVEALLRFVAEVRGYSGAEKRRRVGEAAEKAQLLDVLRQPVDTLSKGYKRRVGLAQAILHDPPVLILDEPTDGLDPNQKYDVRRLVQEMAPHKAIIVSTHILEEVDAVCTRAVVIARGRVVADAHPDELRTLSPRHNAVRVRIAADGVEGLAKQIRRLPVVREVEIERAMDGMADLVVLPRDGREIAADLLGWLRAQGVAVTEFFVEQGRLDDVFRVLTTRAEREAAAHA